MEMNRNAKTPVSDDVVATFVRLDANEATAGHLELLVQWAERSPEKLDQFEELAKLWDYLGDVDVDPALLQQRRRALLPGLANKIGRWLGGWRYPAAAFAVSLAVAITYNLLGGLPGKTHSYATGRGEIQQVQLIDGSHIHLNGLTQLDVEYNDRQRHIRLKQGEAFFEVAKAPDRAFVVAIEGAQVRAVGTAFNIDKLKNQASIRVTEGAVEVAVQDSIQKPIRIKAGEAVEIKWAFNEKGIRSLASLTRKPIADNAGSLAWRNGKIYLSGETLALALEKINRQSLKNIVIVDDRLRSLPIYGTFDLKQIDSFLDALSYMYAIEPIENSQSIALRRKGD